MLGPLPVGLLGGTVEPPTFSGYYSGHTYGVLGLEWDDLEPLGVTGSGLTFSVVSGSLPPGLSLNPSTGVISGTPVSAGVNPVVVRCSNGAGFVDSPNYSFSFMPTSSPNHILWYGDDLYEVEDFWPNGFNKKVLTGDLILTLASGGGGGGAFNGPSLSDSPWWGGGGGGSGRHIEVYPNTHYNGSTLYALLGSAGLGGGTIGVAGDNGEASHLNIGAESSYWLTVSGGGGGQVGSIMGVPALGGAPGGGNNGMAGFPGQYTFAELTGDADVAYGGSGAYGVSDDPFTPGIAGPYGIYSKVTFNILGEVEDIVWAEYINSLKFAGRSLGQGGGGGSQIRAPLAPSNAILGFLGPGNTYSNFGKGGNGANGFLMFSWA